MALTVAVIGAGPGGMAASMALRSAGAMITCFEISGQCGGIWNALSSEKTSTNSYINEAGPYNSRGVLSPIYPSMQCILPKELMAFDDHRFPFAVPTYPHHSAVKKYLHDFSSANGLGSVTRFNTKVESVRWDKATGGWKVLTVNVNNGDVFEWTFDAVVVATGSHHQPRFPPPEATPLADQTINSFTEEGGEVFHSSGAKDVRRFRGQRVIVVGDGVAAYDHCRELLRAGVSEVFHSTMMEPGLDDSDTVLSFNFLNNLYTPENERTAAQMEDEKNSAKKGSSNTYTLHEADGRTNKVWFEMTISTMVASLPFLKGNQHRANELLLKWMRYRTAHILKVKRYGKIVKYEGKHVVLEEDPTKQRSTAEVLGDAMERTATQKARVDALRKREQKKKVAVDTKGTDEASADEQKQLDDEQSGHFDTDELPEDALAAAAEVVEERQWQMLDNIDAIIYCTGYELSFPFLPDEIRDVVEKREGALQVEASGDVDQHSDAKDEKKKAASAMKRLVQSGVGSRRGLFLGTMYAANPTLAFIGTQQELLPPFMMLQGQAKFASQVLTGRYYLPTRSIVDPDFVPPTASSDGTPADSTAADESKKIINALEKFNETVLTKREDDIMAATPGLRKGELYSLRGLGVNSIAYHDMLMSELLHGGLAGHDDDMPVAWVEEIERMMPEDASDDDVADRVDELLSSPSQRQAYGELTTSERLAVVNSSSTHGDGSGANAAVLSNKVGGVYYSTFMQRLVQRRNWVAGNALTAIYNKGRSLAPQQRKQQHKLISNKI